MYSYITIAYVDSDKEFKQTLIFERIKLTDKIYYGLTRSMLNFI